MNNPEESIYFIATSNKNWVWEDIDFAMVIYNKKTRKFGRAGGSNRSFSKGKGRRVLFAAMLLYIMKEGAHQQFTC